MDGRADDPLSSSVPGTLGALATQVKPPFMLPAVATAAFGALLAPSVAPLSVGVHAACVALAVYVAHLRDEHVDAYVRGEEAPSVPARPLVVATVAGVVLLLASLAALWRLAGPLAAAATLPLPVLALLHAPYLDTNPVAGSLDYPVAIGFVVVGGYAAQTGAVPGWVVWVAAPFVLVLAGVGVSLDRLDRSFDATIDKRTVPVVLGDDPAALVAAGLVAGGGVVVLAAVGVGALPATAALAATVPLAAAVVVARAAPELAVRVQMVAGFPFAGALFVGTCLGVDCVVVRLVLG